ncbi:hypothetical protein RCC89_14590 [Cytophagaceae bacterium ABcell3]|nr:hypothetical protein RCC89_14590 [Cytophagaceae bacterium ABcell3]
MIYISDLIHHLKKCPEVFFYNQETHPEEDLQTSVLLLDIFRRVYGDFSVDDSELPSVTADLEDDVNHLTSMQLACWFFSFDFFKGQPHLVPKIHQFLFEDLKQVCAYVKSREWVEDEDRAEEFIRLALARCEITPSGESTIEAADRLEALDTVKRQAVLKETNESMERIREIRRQMAEKKARESANVYSRE